MLHHTFAGHIARGVHLGARKFYAFGLAHNQRG